MGIASIPVRLSIQESSAMALRKAADDLANAADTETFLAALEANHRLWRTLAAVAVNQGWPDLDGDMADFVLRTSAKAGRGLRDELVESLIDINRRVSARLARGRDVESVGRRVVLAWKETGQPYGLSLESWLLSEIERKARTLH